MKTISYYGLIILIILIFSFCEKQSLEENSVEQKNPYNGTKERITKIYEISYKFGEKIEHLNGIKKEYYDKEGNVIEFLHYDSKDSLIEKQLMKYNLKRERTEFLSYDKTGSLKEKEVISFDSLGNKIKRIQIIPNEPTESYKTIYKYDKLSKQDKLFSYNINGSFIHKTVIKKDSLDNYLESVVYDSDNNITLRVVYKYDSNNNKIERLSYGSKNNLVYKFLYKYDSKNTLIEELFFNSYDTLESHHSYKYDSKGNEIERIEIGNYEEPEYDSKSRGIIFIYKKTKTIIKLEYDSINREIEKYIYDVNNIFKTEELELVGMEKSEYLDLKI